MRHAEMKDEDLALKARAGDEDALECLLERYKPLMRSLAGRYYIRGADNDDVIQEAMIGLFKAVQSYDPASGLSFSAVVSRRSEQEIIDAIRKAEAGKHSILNDSLSLEHYYPKSEEEAMRLSGTAQKPARSTTEAEEEILQTLRSLKEKLSDLEYKILRLRLKGLSYREIAERLELKNSKSVDNALQRVRRKLRDRA